MRSTRATLAGVAALAFVLVLAAPVAAQTNPPPDVDLTPVVQAVNNLSNNLDDEAGKLLAELQIQGDVIDWHTAQLAALEAELAHLRALDVHSRNADGLRNQLLMALVIVAFFWVARRWFAQRQDRLETTP